MGMNREYYTVQHGDSWYSIAKKFNLKVNYLIQLNDAFYEEDGVQRVRPPMFGESIRLS